MHMQMDMQSGLSTVSRHCLDQAISSQQDNCRSAHSSFYCMLKLHFFSGEGNARGEPRLPLFILLFMCTRSSSPCNLCFFISLQRPAGPKSTLNSLRLRIRLESSSAQLNAAKN